MKRIRDLMPRGKGKGSRADSSNDDSRGITEAPQQEKGVGEAEGKDENGLDDLDSLFDELSTSSSPGGMAMEEDPFPVSDLIPGNRESLPDEGVSGEPPGHPPVTRKQPPAASLQTSQDAFPPDPANRAMAPHSSPDEELVGDISSLRNTVGNLENFLTDLRRNLQHLGKRQQATEKQIEDLLERYELISKQFRPNAPAEGKTLLKGLPEHTSTNGISEQSGDSAHDSSNEARYESVPTHVTTTAPGHPPAHASGMYGRHEQNTGLRRRGPVLNRLRNDYSTIVLVMRWIEFLLERVKRDKISVLLDYYRDIGWISSTVKGSVMRFARGSVQDVTAYQPELEDDSMDHFAMSDEGVPVMDDRGTAALPHYRQLDDWRLSAEDHLKSLLFVKKIAGSRIDKDELNALEQDISVMKYSFRRYHEV